MDLKERRNYIGASECAAVLGLSKHKTMIDVWAEKTGQVEPENLEGNLNVELGNELEDYVARKFSKETGKKVHKVKEAYTHKKYDFLRCHIDRKVEGESAILQCKTCSEGVAKEWEGEEIPDAYICQEYHELACTNYDRAYIAVIILGYKKVFKWKVIERDNDIINDITKKEVDFWNNYVIPKIMPMQVTKHDNAVLQKLFPKAIEGKEILLGDDVNRIIESLQGLSTDKRVLEGEIARLKNNLKARIKENEIGNTGIYTVKWKNIHKDAYEVKEQNFRQIYYSKIKQEA